MKIKLIAVGVVSLFIPVSLFAGSPIKVPGTPDISKVAEKEVDKAQKKAEKKAEKHIDDAEKKAKDEVMDEVEKQTGDTGKKVKEGKKAMDAVESITK